MIGLFLIGMPLTIIGLYVAYHIGSRKEKTLSELLQEGFEKEQAEENDK